MVRLKLGLKEMNLFVACLVFVSSWLSNYSNASNIFDVFSARQEESGGSLPEDATLTTDQLISKYGFKSERHFVETDDGYILQMHRIVRENSQPFFLMHGLEDSSAAYVLLGTEEALGYLLNNLRYDVWIGNARGNRYSRNHTSINPDDPSFWDFSWHEIGVYDLPAMLDYVLKVTGYEKLHYIGHSQGTTSYFVMCSKRPEYNDKIILMQALAPAVFFGNIPNIAARAGARNLDALSAALENMKISEVPPGGLYGMEFCLVSPIVKMICDGIIISVAGANEKMYNYSLTSLMAGHIPAGAAVKQLLHYGQSINSRKFREYDYGRSKNMKKYGAPEPPDYDLGKCSAPVVLHYAYSDVFVHPRDVEPLYKKLANCIGKYLVPLKEFNHIDFLWTKGAKKLVHERIFRILREFDEGTLQKVIE